MCARKSHPHSASRDQGCHHRRGRGDRRRCRKFFRLLGPTRLRFTTTVSFFALRLTRNICMYLMQSDAFNGPKEAFVTRAKMKRLTGDGLAKLRIPVPPLEVQREIVQILDHFIMLEAELEAELEARKHQRLAFTRTMPEAPRIKALSSDVARARTARPTWQPSTSSHCAVQSDETYTNLGVKWYGEGAFARESKLGSAIREPRSTG